MPAFLVQNASLDELFTSLVDEHVNNGDNDVLEL